MARERWTLALILICLPILATVITAFRIRDLPKPHDSAKLETKKTQKCENCDVKISQKVHSAKIESDKPKYDELKKSIHDKHKPINEQASVSVPTHKYDLESDEKDDDQDALQYAKIQIGFRKEFPKDSKIIKGESDVKNIITTKKNTFGLDKIDSDSANDEDKDSNTGKVPLKHKTSDVKKEPLPKPKPVIKISQPNIVPKKTVVESRENDDDDNDNDQDSNTNVVSKPKLSVKKKTLMEKPKHDTVNIKTGAKKLQNVDTSEELDDDEDDSYDGGDDEDEEDEEDDDDDEYEGLDYVDELFKILNMKPSVNLKSEKEQKIQSNTELKSKKTKNVKTDDDADGDDDSEDNDADIKTEFKMIPPKTSHSVTKDDKESHIKKVLMKSDRGLKTETNNESQNIKDSKAKMEEPLKKVNIKADKEVDKKATLILESKKPEALNKVDKPLGNTKKIDVPAQKLDKENVGNKEKIITVTKKEYIKEQKEKNVNNKHEVSSVTAKKSKEPEIEIAKLKSLVKDDINHDKLDKNPIHEPKKDQTEHKDIFKQPEHKKDIKYDFEKPNAYKDSQRTFDYSEFEKMQVIKSHHKDKRKEKVSSETDSREERYLKHVTDALNRRNLLKSEFEDFYAFLPTFAPNFSRIHNPECRRHGQILLRQLRGTKIWALNMLDATAKIPSGVLQGNGIQLGDFDQCLGSRARVQLDTGSVVKVQGKYCLARIDLKAEHTALEAPVYLAQAKSLFRSRLEDPGHFVPRFSTLSWGVCVPSACDREDVEVIVKDAIKHYQHKSGVLIKVKVDENDCHTDEEKDWEEWLELPTILTLSFYGVIILLVLVATVQDFVGGKQLEDGQENTNGGTESNQKDKDDEENKEESQKTSDSILSPFSLYNSINKLVASGSTDEISCIHGIRGIATLALLLAHKFLPVASMPYTNRLKITEMLSSPFWSWCRAGWVFTDCFLLLSGTLTSYRIAGNGNSGAVWRLFSRYLRLTPALLVVVLFYAYVWDKLSNGPMWGTFVTKNAEVCEQGWWWNLLYVQNYFGMENMCAPHTHQLALDMQLTVVGGIIVWALQSGIPFAALILPGLHILAGYLRYTTVRDHRLTMLAYHGVSVSQLYRTARMSYTSALHRCSPYLIGISLGLALKKPAKHGKFLLTLGWLTSIGLGALVAWSGIDSGSTQYRYNATFAAQYATIAPVASAMAIAWVIYAVQSGTCDFLSRILCWRPLVIISRLSYALYLCQFIIFITNIGTVRTSREFTFMSLIDVQEMSAILLSSIVLTLTFVIPMQSLHKIFYFEWKSEPEKSPEKEIVGPKPVKEEKIEKMKEATPPIRIRHNLVAHREVLEEIPEVEVEYETQRENTEGLDEIVEEEEGTVGEEEDDINDLEIIEEEEAGEEREEAWQEREGERAQSRGDDQDMDEWEWTANGSGRSGAQYSRYAR